MPRQVRWQDRSQASRPTCGVLVAFLVACGGSRSAPAAKKDAAVPVVEHRDIPLTLEHLPQPVVELPKLESFTLLDAGKGAKRTLRYAVPAGSSTYTAKTRLRSKHLASGTWSAVQELPAITDGFTASVADPTRPLVLRATLATVAKHEPGAEAYLATWHAIENRVIQLGVDHRGQLGKVVFADDPSTTHSAAERDEIVQRLLLTLVPLPEEPVAAGARWQVVTILRQRPAVVKQTATYTLVAAGARGWTIEAKIVRIAEEQMVTDPALPPGVLADVVAFVRTANAKLTVTPDHLFPTGTIALDSTLHVRIAALPRDQQEQIFQDSGTITLR